MLILIISADVISLVPLEPFQSKPQRVFMTTPKKNICIISAAEKIISGTRTNLLFLFILYEKIGKLGRFRLSLNV